MRWPNCRHAASIRTIYVAPAKACADQRGNCARPSRTLPRGYCDALGGGLVGQRCDQIKIAQARPPWRSCNGRRCGEFLFPSAGLLADLRCQLDRLRVLRDRDESLVLEKPEQDLGNLQALKQG